MLCSEILSGGSPMLLVKIKECSRSVFSHTFLHHLTLLLKVWGESLCCDFILCAVATFWAMLTLLVRIYPGWASTSSRTANNSQSLDNGRPISDDGNHGRPSCLTNLFFRHQCLCCKFNFFSGVATFAIIRFL